LLKLGKVLAAAPYNYGMHLLLQTPQLSDALGLTRNVELPPFERVESSSESTAEKRILG
jgi:hypothetical protein